MKRIWKKSMCCLMAVTVVLSCLSYRPAAEKRVIAAEQGNEEEKEYIPIRSVDELYAIRNDLKGNYRLMNDIDLSGSEWVPIEKFNGVLDGNGYRIKGMTIKKSDVEDDEGLFGRLENAIIRNLGMCDVDINILESSSSCGAIAGDAAGAYIANCFVSGQICSNGIVGGLIGGYDNSGGSDFEITNCYNTASIQRIKDGDYIDEGVGGIMGADRGNASVTNCYNHGSINNGNGKAIGGGMHKNCAYLKESGTGKWGDTPLSDEQMKNANYFTNFDFKDVWEVDPDSLYTYPQLKSCMQIRITNLSLDRKPTKTEYKQGDKLDVAGGKIAITYEDGRTSTASITDTMVSGYDMMKIGTQNVTVRKGNLTVSYSIMVKEIPITSVTLNVSSLEMKRGDEETLKASVFPKNATDQDITWATDNSKVVTVDQNGKVRAVGDGRAKVTATASNGVKATCQISVIVPCESIEFDREKLTYIGNGDGEYNEDEYEGYWVLLVKEGEKAAIPYTKYPAGSTEKIEWEVKDEVIVSVDATDTLSGLQSGITEITGKTADGSRESLIVVVTEDISGFTVSGIEDKFYSGSVISESEMAQNLSVTSADGTRVLQSGVDYLVSYSPNMSAGTASITVSGILPYTGTIVREFAIRPIATLTPPLVQPSIAPQAPNNQNKKITLGRTSISSIKVSGKKLTIKWKKVAQASGYQIQIARNRKFTNGVKNYKVSSSYVKGWVKGKRKTTYYIRIRAYAYDSSKGEWVYGRYSAVKKKKTK